jgi:CRP/FNR family transcriptional regulator
LSAERRMAHFLLDIANRQSERGLSENRFNLTMTRHDIANYLGLAVETVSRILTRLQKAEILDVERRSIEIKDVPYLERILNNSPPLPDEIKTSA